MSKKEKIDKWSSDPRTSWDNKVMYLSWKPNITNIVLGRKADRLGE